MGTDIATGSIIVVRTAIIYMVVLGGMRLFGKRELGQMTPFDLVLLLLIANAVQNGMTGPDTSVVGGIVAATTLLCLNWALARVVWKDRRIRHWVEGTPTVLIHNGHLVQAHLLRERITEDDLHQALREHGIARVADVHWAILEVDGSISVLRKDELPTEGKPHHRIRYIRRAKG